MTTTNDMTVDALASGALGRFVWVTGKNFSGRSTILQSACEHYSAQSGQAITIPPEVHDAISGLVPTIKEEIMLHIGQGQSANGFWNLAGEWDLMEFAERDPFTLSGGEQAMLVVLCKLALKPKLLCMDGALEQLDPDNLRRVLEAFYSGTTFSDLPQTILTHNGQLPEYKKAEIPQFSAAQIADVERIPSPPSLDFLGFSPTQVHERVAINLVDFTFQYPHGASVFKRLNLRLEPGRVYRLAGPNGVGKSTLARLLTGVLRPMHGEIIANGKAFDSYSRPGTLARLHFQSPDSQLFESTVRDELNSLSPDAMQSAARFAGLDGFLNQHPFDLPFVLRKRLALTLILHTSSPWLIFDEPTLGQDDDARAAIGLALRKLAKAGRGIILISHNSEFARSYSDEELDLRSLNGI